LQLREIVVQDLENAMLQGHTQGLEAENADFRRIASELSARIRILRKLLQKEAAAGVRSSPFHVGRKWN
jgi:hypothetical protein